MRSRRSTGAAQAGQGAIVALDGARVLCHVQVVLLHATMIRLRVIRCPCVGEWPACSCDIRGLFHVEPLGQIEVQAGFSCTRRTLAYPRDEEPIPCSCIPDRARRVPSRWRGHDPVGHGLAHAFGGHLCRGAHGTPHTADLVVSAIATWCQERLLGDRLVGCVWQRIACTSRMDPRVRFRSIDPPGHKEFGLCGLCGGGWQRVGGLVVPWRGCPL